jgi:hypothetical protein
MGQFLHNHGWFEDQIQRLEDMGFNIETPELLQWIVIRNLSLDGGKWTRNGQPIEEVAVWISIPQDFPLTCPGIGFSHPAEAIHIEQGILWDGKLLQEVYACDHTPWVWLCFRKIAWKPRAHDDLITLISVIENSIYERRQG